MANSNISRPKIFTPDVMFSFAVGAVLFILLFPMPKILLSVLLVFNISISLLILLIMFYLNKSLEISSFPTILLVTTLFRLALNVASTKLILLEANAGKVIEAFGKFVVGNNYIVGAVVFLILVMLQMIVITKGSNRIAEVAARFTLDALPGKQMSIDSDLNAGIIDEKEAEKRREELRNEAEFYGAMDGAAKFVYNDARAGLVITVINILGGLGIGVFQKGMPVVDALQRYTVLTIGDGLVSQIPSLLISVAAGILVSKTASQETGTGSHLAKELFKRHQPLLICSVMLFVLAVLPGLPFLPFVILAAASFTGGIFLFRKNRELASEELALAGAGIPGNIEGKERAALPQGIKGVPGQLEEPEATYLSKINPMTLELGFSLVPMVDPNQQGDLVDRISGIRKQIKEELGFLIPPISIQDNIELANNEYRIMVRGLERARGFVHPASYLAINPGDATGKIEGIKTTDPAFGFEAYWITKSKVDSAEAMGYTVVDAASVITTHVTKIVREYAAELLSRQDVSNMLEEIKNTNETVVKELIPNQLSVGVVHRVLQNLLDEKVPIHDLPVILEVLSDYANQTKDPVILAEFARQALKGHIVSQYLSETDHTLYAITLDPELEQEIESSINQKGSGVGIISLSPERAVAITDTIKNTYENLSEQIDADIVLLVSPLIRLHVFRMIARKIEGLPVLSYSEISDDVPLQILGTVKLTREKG